MIFISHKEHYNLSNYSFININTVAIGSIMSILIDGKVVPFSVSSIDKQKNKLLMKMYSEHLERTTIGFNYLKDNYIDGIDLFTNHLVSIKRSLLSYGENGKSEARDTTGSASGYVNSYEIIKKATSELIEKNELFLFWYCNQGERVSRQDTIAIEKHLNMDCYENHIFVAKNLCSWPTIICISFMNKIVVGTGISCDSDYFRAIENAIAESKILRVLNSYKFDSIYDFGIKKNEEIYNWVNSFQGLTGQNHFTHKIKNYNICMSDQIEDLFVYLLNTKTGQDGKTVSVTSSSLIKCLPTKKNILMCSKIPIISNNMHHITNNKLDCFIS